MAERTLYDLLEVSNTASQETISAAYERLSAKLSPAIGGNTANADARFQYEAIKDAFFVLSNAEKRAQYDRKLELRSFTPVRQVEVMEPFWTLPKLIVIGIVVLGIGGFYYKHQKEQARLEAEKVIAVAKAKEAEAKAQAEAEVERLAAMRESERERGERSEAARLRRERDTDVRQFQRENRVNEITNRVFTAADRAQAQREDSGKRATEARLKREEAQAAAASRQSLARDRAELCRIERERYGKTISC